MVLLSEETLVKLFDFVLYLMYIYIYIYIYIYSQIFINSNFSFLFLILSTIDISYYRWTMEIWLKEIYLNLYILQIYNIQQLNKYEINSMLWYRSLNTTSFSSALHYFVYLEYNKVYHLTIFTLIRQKLVVWSVLQISQLAFV